MKPGRSDQLKTIQVEWRASAASTSARKFRRHSPGRKIYSPNGRLLFSAESFRGESVFLTNGTYSLTYKDLPTILQAARHLFEDACRTLNMEYADFTGASKCVAGIDTTNRIESILWMVFCWVNTIPFVPFHPENPGALNVFRPDVVIRTSGGKQSISHSSNDGNGLTYYEIPVFQRSLLGDETGHSQVAASPDLTLKTLIPFTHHPDVIFCGLATSGTSGRPKGVALLRKNMIAATRNAFREVRAATDTREHLWGHCLPLHHTGGISIVFRALLSGTGIYLWDRFDSRNILDVLRNQPAIKRISLVPTMLHRLLDYQEGYRMPYDAGLNQLLVGGGPANPGLVHHARKMGWPVTFSYGMTETCGQIASQKLDGSSPDRSVGSPFPDHEIQIRDDQGKELAPDMIGSLHVRGPQLFPGYLSESDTLNSFISKVHGSSGDRWFDTGDFARADSRGNLYIEARRTDLIISGGENINPEEIESILQQCSEIDDAGVTWIPDHEWGQLVVALIVPKSRNPEAEQRILAFTSSRLKAYMRPKRIGYIGSLPRSALGKIERKKLQELAINQFA